MLFTEPPETEYDLRFSVFGFPVRVHPLFWLVGLLLGISAGSVTSILIWVAALFVSILIHELGHAVAFRVFGQPARVVLYHLGGLAIPGGSGSGWRGTSRSLTSWQQIAISLAGPGAGFLLAALVLAGVAALGGMVGFFTLFGMVPIPRAMLPGTSWIISSAIGALIWINVFWGLINLLPVFPLDGGQVARHVAVMFDPWEGVETSLWISTVTGVAVAALGLLLLGSLWITLLFGILALQSFQALQAHA